MSGVSMNRLACLIIIRFSSKIRTPITVYGFHLQGSSICTLVNKLFQTLLMKFLKRKRPDSLSSPLSIIKSSRISKKKFTKVLSFMLMRMIMESAKLIKNKFQECQRRFGVGLEVWGPCGGKKELMKINDLKRPWFSVMRNWSLKLSSACLAQSKPSPLSRKLSWRERKFIQAVRSSSWKSTYLG